MVPGRERASDGKSAMEEKKQGKITLRAWIAGTIGAIMGVEFCHVYPPFVTIPVVAGLVYACEHLGALGASTNKLDEQGTSMLKTARTLDMALGEIGILLNRLGTIKWTVKVTGALKEGFKVFGVYAVWDDLPKFDDITKTGSLNMFTVRWESWKDGVVAEDDGSLFHTLLQRFKVSPTAKTHFMARLPVARKTRQGKTQWLLPAAADDTSNVLGLFLQLVQVRMINNWLTERAVDSGKELESLAAKLDLERGQTYELTCRKTRRDGSEGRQKRTNPEFAIDYKRTSSDIKRTEINNTDFSKLLACLSDLFADYNPGPQTYRSRSATLLLKHKVTGTTLYWQTVKGIRLPLMTSRPYHVLLQANSTIPWLTLIGSPRAPLRKDLPHPNDRGLSERRRKLGERLEFSYAVALVVGNPALNLIRNDVKVKRYNLPVPGPTTQQDWGKDYAFDLLATPDKPAFDEMAGEFANELEASGTRLTLGATSRLQANELRHSVPTEIYLVGRILESAWNDRSCSSMSDFVRILGEDLQVHTAGPFYELVTVFVQQQNRLGAEKNGRPPCGENEVVQQLIWRNM